MEAVSKHVRPLHDLHVVNTTVYFVLSFASVRLVVFLLSVVLR